MIDRFKKWLSSNKKKEVKPINLNKTDIEQFRKESNDILSYILDNGDIFIVIDEYLKDYKVRLVVDTDICETKNFYDIKEDFIQYIYYMFRKYKIEQQVQFSNDKESFYKNYQISELDNLPNIKFNYISFYIRK